jgi:enoyl-CoA hydratase/carnithine racemase
VTVREPFESDSIPEILTERRDGVVTVTLNRPERLNALTGAMWIDLARIFAEVAKNQSDRDSR